MISDVSAGKANAYAKIFAGGIAGYLLNSSVTRCLNEGSIHATAMPSAGNSIMASVYAGGILGAGESSYYNAPILYSGNSVSYCGNSADITAKAGPNNSLAAVGGLVGYTNGYFRMISCFNTGNIDAYADDAGMQALRAGGFVGSAGYGDVHIAYSYNIGHINASGTDVGAAVGYTMNGVRSSYLVAADTSADRMFGKTLSGSAYDTGSVMRTLGEMKERGAYEWPSFSTIWVISPGKNNGLPHFISDMAETYTIFFVSAGGNYVPPMTAEAGDVLTLPVPSKSGAVFKGWYTEPSGAGDKIESLCVVSNITLYAHWEVTETSAPSENWIWLLLLFLIVMTAMFLMYTQEKRKHKHDRLK